MLRVQETFQLLHSRLIQHGLSQKATLTMILQRALNGIHMYNYTHHFTSELYIHIILKQRLQNILEKQP